MRERPIIFTGPSVRAILAGTKTQTRRVVKLPRMLGEWEPLEIGGPGTHLGSPDGPPAPLLLCIANDRTGRIIANPWYWPEPSRLWVREAFAPCVDHHPDALTLPEYEGGHNPDHLYYRADVRNGLIDGCNEDRLTWHSPIFMPRWASRVLLEVTDVRVERLHLLTEEDARAEGVTPSMGTGWDRKPCVMSSAREVFERGWDVINGKRAPWTSNPWVFVVNFRRCQ